MKNRGVTVLQLLLSIGAVLIACATFRSIGHPCTWSTPRSICLGNLHQLGLSLLQYVNDYDNKFPANECNHGDAGWAFALLPYTKNELVLQCPSEPTKLSPGHTSTGYTDYWLNSAVAGVKLRGMPYPGSTILLGEGNDGSDKTDACYAKSGIPYSWIGNSQEPCYRHNGGANYAFCDGHVRWAFPTEISQERPTSQSMTFAIK